MRIDPPPSLACAIGTTPDATSAAAPPDDAPLENAVSQGFRVGSHSSNSVLALQPNSGNDDLPSGTSPAARSWVVNGASAAAGTSGMARDP